MENTGISEPGFLWALADNIAAQFGENCEVAVHEFRGDTLYIEYIVNGHVTGRQVGDVSTDAFQDEYIEKDFHRNPVYRLKTADGRELLASTTPITLPNGMSRIICINYDISNMLNARKALFWVENGRVSPEEGDVNQLLEKHLEACERLIGKSPEHMSRQEKLRAVEYLEHKHVFLITKSGDRVCEFLNLTKYALYAFLEEIRKAK